jgi:hypothetical protein
MAETMAPIGDDQTACRRKRRQGHFSGSCTRPNSSSPSTFKRRMRGIELPPRVLSIADEVIE